MEMTSFDNRDFCLQQRLYSLPAKQPNKFCNQWFYDQDLWKTRGLFVTNNGSILTIDAGKSPAEIVALVDYENDGIADDKFVIAIQDGLSHGIGVYDNKVYASSTTSLYRWSYIDGQTVESNDMEVVITSMPTGGHHTRSFVFDEINGYLYLQVGSGSNIDSNIKDIQTRSIIRRFHVSSLSSSSLPIDYSVGEVVANGMRNEVGLAFDQSGRLYGVENSGDNLNRPDLGGDIHNNNPSEELNRIQIDTPWMPRHYGYPYCFTAFNISEHQVDPNNHNSNNNNNNNANIIHHVGRNSIWAWPTFMNDHVHTDEWCRNNTVPPILSIQPHTAPLGITFFDSTKKLHPNCPSIGRFPDILHGDAFIALHGSWDRDTPIGYKIVRVPMSKETGLPLDSTSLPYDFFYNGESTCAQWSSGWRPVDVKFDSCNRLLVSSDTSGGVLMISYHGYSNDTDISFIQSVDDVLNCKSDNQSMHLDAVTWWMMIIIFGLVGISLVQIGVCCFCYRKRFPTKSRTKSFRDKEAHISKVEYELVSQATRDDMGNEVAI